MLDVSLDDLRVLRTVLHRGSFTAAAAELGYTQSAISKRIAMLEQTTGHTLVIRERRGTRLTRAGEVLLRHGAIALEAMDEAERELGDENVSRVRPVKLGAFASAAAGIVPLALKRLTRDDPEIVISLREGTTASLMRALRAGTLDLALLIDVAATEQPDDFEAALEFEVLAEGPLRVAVGASHRLTGRSRVSVEELTGEHWVAARSEGRERLLGVWPGLPRRPDARHVARDWLTKLRLVASGAAITTVPDVLVPALPPGVQAVNVTDSLVQRRRLLLCHIPGTATPESQTVAAALRNAVAAP